MNRKLIILLTLFALIFAVFSPPANVKASSTTKFFNMSIYNAIQAQVIGYPRNYQFVFSIYTNGYLVRQFLLRQGQRVDLTLPKGSYAFSLSDRNGKLLAKEGYRFIDVNTRVRWQSHLGPPDRIPRISVRIF